jgi:hypothetical protein
MAHDKKEYMKAYNKSYKKAEKYKAYVQSEKYKAYSEAYVQSEKYKAHKKAYNKSEGGVISQYCSRKLQCKQESLSQEMKDAIYALYKLNCAIRNAQREIKDE